MPSEGRPLPSYPHIPEEVASKEGTLPGRLTTVEDKEKLFFDSSIPGMDALYKGMLPHFAGGTVAALNPDEAEAARPWNGKGVADIVEQISTGDIKGGLLGRFSEEELGELQKRNPAYTKPEHVMTAENVAHVRNSQLDKPKQKHKKTPDEVGDMLNSITTSTRRRFVTTKEGHPTGVVVPHGDTTYPGILEPEDGGRAGIWTVYAPKTEKLPNKLGSSDSGRRNVPI